MPNASSRPVVTIADPPATISEREKQVLSLFNEQYYIVRKDVEAVAGVSQATAVVLLREMVKKGLLTRVGAGRLVKYKLAE